MNKEELDKLANKVIGIAIEIHKLLGPGFKEKVYSKALTYEMNQKKIKYETEKLIRIKYKNILLGNQKIDFLLEDDLLLEIKALPEIQPIHINQMLSYLKTSDKKLGLILNFGESKLGIKRVVNNF